MFSTTQLAKLDADLSLALTGFAKEAPKMMSKGGLNIKTYAREHAPHGPHTPSYAASITYDVIDRVDEIRTQVGPDKNRPQGPLGNIFELGSPGRPPHPHLMPALDAEEPRFKDNVAMLAEQTLKKHLR